MRQKGFILPTTVILSFFIVSILVQQVYYYKAEQLFIKEYEQLEILQSLLQIGIKDIMTELQEIEDFPDRMTQAYQYPQGKVIASISPYDEDIVKISLLCQTNKDRKQKVLLLYQLSNRTILKWLER